MDKIAIKQQIIILVAIFAFMLVLFFFFAWKPQMAELDKLAKQKAEEEQKLQLAKNTLMRLEDAKKNAANVEIKMIKLANRIPSDPELPSLIVELQNMANDAGVMLRSISPGEPTSVGEYSEIKINITGTGAYVPLTDFLRRIEKALRALKVTSVTIKYDPQSGSYPDLDFTVTVVAFTVDSTNQAPPPPPPPNQAKAGSTTN